MNRIQGVRKGVVYVAPPPPDPGGYPAWRSALVAGTWTAIPSTGGMNGYAGFKQPWLNGSSDAYWGTEPIIVAWNGLTGDGKPSHNVWYSVTASGHGDWQNPIVKLDLTADQPQWATLDPGSDWSEVVDANMYWGTEGSQRPASTHTYYTQQHVRGANTADGKQRLFRMTDFAAYKSNTSGAYQASNYVHSFRVADLKWDVTAGVPAPTPSPLFVAGVSCCQNRNTDEIYLIGGNSFARYNPKTNAWAYADVFSGLTPLYAQDSANMLRAWNYMPSLCDVSRNRVVGLSNWSGNGFDTVPWKMQAINLTTLAVTNYTPSGTGVADWYFDAASTATPRQIKHAALVHDLDNDRYLLAISNTGELYAINPETWVVTKVADIPINPVKSKNNGYFNRLAYWPDYHCITIYPYYEHDVLAMPTA